MILLVKCAMIEETFFLHAQAPMREEVLDPELTEYIEDMGRFGTYIKHPLVFQPYFNAAYCNRMLRDKRAALQKAVAEKNWSQVIWVHERPYRLMAFMQNMPSMSDADYWEQLGDVWTDSENIWQDYSLWHRLLESKKPHRECFMCKDERTAFAKLPDVLTVYRGYVPRKNRRGMSYTLNPEKAHWFANRYGPNGQVVTLTVPKGEVFAYINRRQEEEIIIVK